MKSSIISDIVLFCCLMILIVMTYTISKNLEDRVVILEQKVHYLETIIPYLVGGKKE